jgi:hypothetical protein
VVAAALALVVVVVVLAELEAVEMVVALRVAVTESEFYGLAIGANTSVRRARSTTTIARPKCRSGRSRGSGSRKSGNRQQEKGVSRCETVLFLISGIWQRNSTVTTETKTVAIEIAAMIVTRLVVAAVSRMVKPSNSYNIPIHEAIREVRVGHKKRPRPMMDHLRDIGGDMMVSFI